MACGNKNCVTRSYVDDRTRDRQGQEGSDKDKEGCNDFVRTEGGTDKDKEGQTRTRRDRQGQGGHTGTRMALMTC